MYRERPKPIQDSGYQQLMNTLSEFSYIPEEERTNFKKRLHVTEIPKNSHFITIDDIPSTIAFIVEGLFRVYFISDSGKENCLVFRGKGRFLSAYSSFLESRASQYSFQALEDSILLYITIEDYKELLAGNDCWQCVVSKYSQMLFIEKEKREREFLSADAKTRYRIFMNTYPTLSGRISQYHIASYLGITPEALSRIRSQIH
ncbi:Crp/Fnr family transcriptional regulator [uncultured Sphaerochaeta sp.]|uniref:Crp/Fnr family transcriptional regulator n=1 Tax=uncultured Sphaerochaeta sp. TaxID=886478 RepID=UPI002A0A4E0B|nr:Crp/Fnr family transcriptional regulator [uncultured Sphaerochaeta sp.]